MDDCVAIHVQRATYARLQRLAVLAGSESAAIDRLIEHWEQGQRAPAPVAGRPGVAQARVWRSSSGDVLPIGTPLEANYGGRTHRATVEPGGIRYEATLYPSPTAAARAVKKQARGLVGTSAGTNGRAFWRVRDPKSGRLVSLSRLNPDTPIDSEELLKDIQAAV